MRLRFTRWLALCALALLSAATASAQFTESFESGIPVDWTVINQGGSNTWDQDSSPDGGARTGSSVAGILYNLTAHDDYLITPQITVTAGVSDELNFFARSRASFFPEDFNILISTTGTAVSDFVVINGPITAPGGSTWVEYTESLSAYVGQQVYIAIQAISTNEFELYIDDFSITTPPSCDVPSGVAAQNVMLTQVDIAYTPPSGQTNFEAAVFADGDDPNSATPVASNTGSASPIQITGLSSGTAYDAYVRTDCSAAGNGTSVWSQTASFTTLFPPPANDDCASAVSLSVESDLLCSSPVSASTQGATQSLPGCLGTANDDVWFSFEASGSAHTILTSNTGGSSDIVTEVFDACGGTSIDCQDTPNSPVTLTGLTTGVTYYFRVYAYGSTSTTSFEVCVGTPPPPPINDVCASAIPANVGANGTCPSGAGSYSEDFTAVTESGNNPSCDGSGNWDLWYTWEATSASLIFDSQTGGPGAAIYSGSCGSLVEVGCANNFDATFGGLTIGEIYYIQIWDDSQGATSVTWCLEAGPACADPTNLDVSNIGQTSADVTFTAIAAGSHTVEYGPPNFTLGTGTTVAVANGGAVMLTSLTGQTDYEVYVTADCGGSPDGPESFTTLGPPPPNDACASATALMLSPDGSCSNVASGSTEYATPTASGTCSSSNKDVWYSFSPSVSGSYEFTLAETFDSGFGSTYFSLYDGSCGSLSQVGTACFASSGASGVSLIGGTTYYVNIRYSSSSTYSEFDLCVYPTPAPPANDECVNAISIPVNALGTCTGSNGTQVDLTSATDSQTGNPSCDNTGTNYDVWFTFEAPAGGSVLISSVGATTIETAVFDDCAQTTELFCSSSNSDGQTISGLTPGVTYYLNVWRDSQSGVFDLCLSVPPAPPANDACADAITLVSGVSVSGSTNFATNVESLAACSAATGSSSCGGAGGIDFGAGVWYVYQSSSIEEITVTTDLPGTAFDTELQVWEGTCGSLTCVNGDDDRGTVNLGSSSELCFTSTGSPAAPVSYYIYVDGHSTNRGAYEVQLDAVDLILPVSELIGCTSAITETVDGTGTPAEVNFMDGSGNIIATIANTENLGAVTVRLYDDVGARLLPGSTSDYDLGRNVSFIPTTQPSNPVQVKMYATAAEVTSLINQDPNINSVADIQFFKVDAGSCSANYGGGGTPVVAQVTPYGSDWAISASVSSFSEFFAVSQSAPLPVELASFSAYATASGNVVQWTAASEVDLVQYHVERSATATGFEAFTTVAAKGSAEVEAVYETMDYAPRSVTYYRLRAENLDGSVEYSDVVAVTRDGVVGGTFTLSPNPTRGQVYVDFPATSPGNGTRTVTVADAAGRVVFVRTLTTDVVRETLDFAGMAAGLYTVTATDAVGSSTRRLVVE